MTRLTGTVVSFYSYKGGVGRTMSVVNVAMTLAQNGFRVLVVDLDLLAPGVQKFPLFREAVSQSDYVLPEHRKLGEGGILDLVERQLWSSPQSNAVRQPFREAFCPAKGNPDSWKKWMRPAYLDPVSGGQVDMIPAGPADHRAVETLAQMGWYRFLTECDGLPLILSMRDQWWRKHYDFTLIDSRTGLSDYLQFCVGILPDVAVVLAGLNEQNLEGLSAALDGVEQVLPSRRSDLYVIPVLSLIPSAELDHVQHRFNRADELLQQVQKREQEREDGGNKNSKLRFLSEPVRLPYVATLAVTERLVVPDDHDAPIFRPYVQLAEMLARHRFSEIDNLFDAAIYEGAATGLTHPEVIRTLNQAREASDNARYMYGRIKCEKLDAQRLAYVLDPGSLEHFKAAVNLMRERRRLGGGEPWDKADSSIGHWQIELDTLVFYARVLAALDMTESAVQAFADALNFVAKFEKRNHADMFSDRDWDRYSHELLFTRAFCHLGRLEAQIKEVKSGRMIATPALQANAEETQKLFQQLMPASISDGIRKRLEQSLHAVKQKELA